MFEDTTTGTWLTPEARRVGFVFQDHGLFPHLSVLDNVAFGLRARGVDRQTRKREGDTSGSSGWTSRGTRPAGPRR